jgi:hypothetical protein
MSNVVIKKSLVLKQSTVRASKDLAGFSRAANVFHKMRGDTSIDTVRGPLEKIRSGRVDSLRVPVAEARKRTSK